jgi:hypothetical protein
MECAVRPTMKGGGTIEQDNVTQHHEVSLLDVEDEDLRNGIASVINLMDNIMRGTVAEVLVARAFGGEVTDQWGNWDVTLPDRARIEVKATGLIQAWEQTKPSRPVWSVAKSQDWVLIDGVYAFDGKFGRSSDFYVFALHGGIRPDALAEWRFYVVPTQRIDAELGDQKTITESTVQRRFAVPALDYSELCNLTIARP